MIGIGANSVRRGISELSGHRPIERRKGCWRDEGDAGITEVVVSDEIAVSAGVSVLSAEREIGAIHDFEIARVADEVGVSIPVDANRMPGAVVVEAAGDFLLEIVAVHVNGETDLP